MTLTVQSFTNTYNSSAFMRNSLSSTCGRFKAFVHEKYQQTSRKTLLSTFAISTLATAAFFYWWFTPRFNEVIPKDEADPHRIMAEYIKRYEDEKKIQEINGVAFSLIEARGRPGKYSTTGFLGKNENFKNVLDKDWKTVYELGFTHIELADHLQMIWNQSKSFVPTPFYYDVSELKSNTLRARSQLLITSLHHSCGWQDDIFHKEISKEEFLSRYANTTEFSTEEIEQQWEWTSREVMKGDFWGSHMQILHVRTGKTLQVGQGVIDYIRKYGFYEGGGKNNPYRLDPIDILSVLTGYSYCEIASSINQTCDQV